jgi:hypothetical protein
VTSENRDTTAGNEEIANLPERPLEDASQVKGGASIVSPPSGPVPVPYPSRKLPADIRSLEPCL